MATEAPIMIAWEQVLASFASCLTKHREAFEDGSSSRPEVFVPPQGLPPLPEELRPRAELLMLEARALERAEVMCLLELRRRAAVSVPRQQSRATLLDTSF